MPDIPNKAIYIRAAAPNECQVISALGVRAKSVWDYTESMMATFCEELTFTSEDIRGGRVFVLINAHTIVGYYSLAEVHENTIELRHLFVDPQHLR